MKDIVFTAKQQKCELRWLIAAIAVAFLTNIIAIIVYKTEWKEAWTQLIWVIVIGIGLYALSIGVRLVICCIRYLFRK
ncbi:MAG: hypothetical protein LBR50_11665 [Tannerella sp.]|jgi:putative effector of murein hydrolase LrgA (UPF0299 family)|nr:hypothetical protein [Tannerella sp.]